MANYSLSEIDALARKATRGAGYSWGIAEEVGKAVRWLSAYGFSGAEILAEHLSVVADTSGDYIPSFNDSKSDEIYFVNSDQSSCSIYCGSLINDLGHHLKEKKTLSFNSMLSPLLALPSAARVAEAYNISVMFNCDHQTIICQSNGIVIKGTPPLLSTFSLVNKTEVICSLADKEIKNTHFPSPKSSHIEDKALTILEKFAHKTYAPATEESRLRGAG